MLQIVTEELADTFAMPVTVDTSLHMSFMANDIVFRIKQEVAGRIADEVEARYPADWWQAVKGRWLPGWAGRRWPIKETVVKLTARELYPKVALPEYKHVISLTRTEHNTDAI